MTNSPSESSAIDASMAPHIGKIIVPFERCHVRPRSSLIMHQASFFCLLCVPVPPCTPKINLSFNWRLVKAPMNVIEYVIVHELTHLFEQSHPDSGESSRLSCYITRTPKSGSRNTAGFWMRRLGIVLLFHLRYGCAL